MSFTDGAAVCVSSSEVDPEVCGALAAMAAAALEFCARREVFPAFRARLLDASASEGMTDWLVSMEPGLLSAFGDLLAAGVVPSGDLS